MSNFVELLLSAALSKESTNKINTQIKNIQKDLKDITIDFNVNNKGNKTFSEMEKQIKSLQSQLKELQSQLGNVGSSTNSKSKGKGTIVGGISEESVNAIKSLEELERHLKGKGYGVKVDFDYDKNGLKTVKHVLAEIKNQVGQTETLKIKPVVDSKGISSFSLYGGSNNDKNAKGFIESQNKAIQLMEQFGRQGKLTAKDIEDYTKRINNANGNTSLQRTVDQMKELSKISTSDNKHLTATKNLNDQAKQSLKTLEQLRYNASSVGLDTKHIDSLISKMRTLSKIEITNDAQIGKADKLYGRLSSRVSETKNNLSSLITAQEKFNGILNTASNKGIFNTGELERYRNQLNLVMNSSESLGAKLTRLKSITSSLNTEVDKIGHSNKMAEGMKKAQLEAEKLQASLTRTINSYKRTVNMDEANIIKSRITSMSNVPTFGNEKEMKKYMADLKAIEMQIKRLNADSVVGARNSMGVIESFKVAMERFPIWINYATVQYKLL